MATVYWLDPANETSPFPPVELALEEPDGLLAIGGGLEPARLLNAYCQGIFPWYTEGQPILWWSPDPRAVLFPQRLHVSRSLRKTLRRRRFRVTADKAFREVVEACAEPRPDQDGTWITADMANAYERLHRMGFAHSIESWEGNTLAGGLYGVALGRVFFGESMFMRTTDASKVAFVHLVRQLARWSYALIDCQLHSRHLASLGAEDIPRTDFTRLLRQHCDTTGGVGHWTLDADLVETTAGSKESYERP